MKTLFAIVLALCTSSALAAPHSRFAQRYRELAKLFRNTEASTFEDYVPGLPGGFQCPVLAASPAKPTNARLVRPADISVVAALGDSLTAGYGVLATSVTEVIRQYRGLSWSIGGDSSINDVLTFPNILKKYNPRLFGQSFGSSLIENTPTAFYNVASGGDTADDMAKQSTNLIDKILADRRQNDWKIITIFVGGNDVCGYCEEPEILSPENYKKNILNALDSFYSNFRNTIVNLAGPIDMTHVIQLPNTAACVAVHRSLCGCVYNESDPDYATRLSRAYEAQIEQIVVEAETRYPRIDFAIAYQPQFTRVELPYVDGRIDLSYFAPDCFHLSQKGQEHAAVTLWNNMLKPMPARARSLQFGNRTMNCITEDSPYIKI